MRRRNGARRSSGAHKTSGVHKTTGMHKTLGTPRPGGEARWEGLGVSFIRDIARDKTCPKDSEVLSLLSCSLGRQEKHILYNLIIRKDVADAQTQQSEESLSKSCIFAQCCFGHAHFQ